MGSTPICVCGLTAPGYTWDHHPWVYMNLPPIDVHGLAACQCIWTHHPWAHRPSVYVGLSPMGLPPVSICGLITHRLTACQYMWARHVWLFCGLATSGYVCRLTACGYMWARSPLLYVGSLPIRVLHCPLGEEVFWDLRMVESAGIMWLSGQLGTACVAQLMHTAPHMQVSAQCHMQKSL